MKTYLANYRTQRGLQPAVIVDDILVGIEEHLGTSDAMRGLIARGPTFLDTLFESATAAVQRGNVTTSVKKAQLGPAISDPQKIICLGLNYRDHAAEAGLPIPASPVLFAKYANSLIGPYDDVLVPAVAQGAVDYEAELAVVIGRRALRVDAADALSFVAAYTAFNDVTARDLQFATSQWGAGKAIDTFGPLGPFLVPRSTIPNPQALRMKTWVNGTIVQDGKTSDMIFGVAETIAYISSFMTLEPGDVIATGTPAGVGFTRKPAIHLQDGDVMEVEIERIGRLRNKVVWETPK